MSVLSIEQVLADEAKEIHGDNEETRKLAEKVEGQQNQDERKSLNEDRRVRHGGGEAKVQPRDEFYRGLSNLNNAALCCSGGGIRSATFCLGVIQALADYDVSKNAPLARSTETNTARPNGGRKRPIAPENSALLRFHYLSTVSGGGYIGSWLSSWRMRSGLAVVIDNLTRRPSGPDVEPAEVSWLRAYSNYLTPQLGITSADSWAAVAICIRNLILNWLVVIPVVCLALLSLKVVATAGAWVAHNGTEPWSMVALGLFGAIFLIVAQAFTNCHRPTRRTRHGDGGEWTFIFGDLIWAIASAIFLTVFFTSSFFSQHLEGAVGSAVQWLNLAGILNDLGVDLKFKLLIGTAAIGLLVYVIGWIAAFRFRNGDFIEWAASGLVYGTLMGLGAYLFHLLTPYPPTPDKLLVLLLAMTLGVPWALASQLVAEIVFVGLASYEDGGDADREWLGRAAGWLAAAAVAWALIAFLVFDGGYFVQKVSGPLHKYIVASGGVIGVISGIVTALLGSSSSTLAKSSGNDQRSVQSILYNAVLAVAGPVFVAILIIALSVGLDLLLLGDSLVNEIQTQSTSTTLPWPAIVRWLVIGLVIVAIVGGLASYFVNINRFSLHALYRNRLIRGYLGASNKDRDPDPFSGFDFSDNVCIYDLWPPRPSGSASPRSLFHIINIALNVVSTKRLAWQERKAESFTVSPRHCGSAYLGFRPSNEYGEYPGKGGLSLGTAMAISGAAVSSNMGYHSSPSIALLLTLFNVRLGWWLGNPGEAGEKTYQKDGPLLAARPLFAEAFGQTTDDSPYVYLSDGGHFENLGLYEMVRRRCRLIVLVDAGCDGDFAFEDLGNAVRKISIDLGIRITFDGLDKLKNRPSAKSLSRAVRDAAALASLQAAQTTEKGGDAAQPGPAPYYAIGTIDYANADNTTPAVGTKPAENGYILYIKPAYHGTETSAGIRSYATANPDFPHETTADQWFTESQFESYRSLGLDIANDILDHEVVLQAQPKFTLHDALRALKVKT